MVNKKGRILYYPDTHLFKDNIMQLKSPNQTKLEEVLQTILSKKSGIVTYEEYDYGKLRILRLAATWDTAPGYQDSNYATTIVVTSEITSNQIISHPMKSTDLSLEEFVNTAYLFAKEKGRDAALAEFNDINGEFTTQEYYIAAFDMDGTILGNPYRQNILGENRIRYQDINDVHSLQMITNRIRQGGGYVTHVYENPAKNMQEEIKISYVLPIDETWYSTAGEFHPGINPFVSPETRAEMIRYAREIEAFTQKNGKEAASAALNNQSHYRADIMIEPH